MKSRAAKLLSRIRQLRRDCAGATAVIFAGSLFALVGAAAVAVDFGSIYLAKRRLQGLADSAALAAASDSGNGQASAQGVIDSSGAQGVTIRQLTLGTYAREKAVAMNTRFAPTASSPTATRITLDQRVPLFFGAMLSGGSTMTVSAQATASRMDMAAFTIGTRLASVSGGLPNQILSALAGSELGLTTADSQGLAAADVDLLGFADALRARVGQPEATYAEIFAMDVPLNKVAGAMADVLTGTAAGDTLAAIESRLGAGPVKLSELVDLGPLDQSDFNDGRTRIQVDAMSLLRSALELSHGDQYAIDLDLSAAGVVSSKLKLVGGQGEVHSPWMTVTSAKDVVIRTAQTRAYLDTQLGNGTLGLLAIRLPVYIELASAEARLTDIACTGNSDTHGVTLSVKPAVGTIAIADINAASLGTMTTPVTLQPAKLAGTALARIDGQATLAVGGVTPQTVKFSKQDIADRRVKTVDTNDLTAGIATSLMSNVQINASLLGGSLLGGGVALGPLVSAVGSKLNLAAPIVDGLVNELTDTLGVRLGEANVRVDKMRCGVPMIVS